jgi:hypothetical protein
MILLIYIIIQTLISLAAIFTALLFYSECSPPHPTVAYLFDS